MIDLYHREGALYGIGRLDEAGAISKRGSYGGRKVRRVLPEYRQSPHNGGARRTTESTTGAFANNCGIDLCAGRILSGLPPRSSRVRNYGFNHGVQLGNACNRPASSLKNRSQTSLLPEGLCTSPYRAGRCTPAARNGIDCGSRQRVVRKRGSKVCHLFQCVLPRFGVRVILEVPGLGFGSTGRPARIGYDAERPFRGWNLPHIEILPRSGLRVTVNFWRECAVLVSGGAIADNPVRIASNKLLECQELST